LTTVQLPPKLQQLVNAKIQHASNPAINPFYKLNAVLNADTRKLKEYQHLLKGKDKPFWEKGCSKEFTCLSQGHKNSDDKNSLHFMHPNQLPKGKKPTYLCICANYGPQKANPYRIQFTVGGNLLNYFGETYTPTANLTTSTTRLFNSAVSTPGTTFFCLDLSNFYLLIAFAHPSKYEYLYIPEWAIPEDIMEEYNLCPLIRKKNSLLRSAPACMASLKLGDLHTSNSNISLATGIFPLVILPDFSITSRVPLL
jgi:hypothetical protein